MPSTPLPPWTPASGPPTPIPVPPAQGTYLRLDDNIRVTSYNSAAGVTLTCRSRMLDLQGAIQASNDQQVPNTNRTAKASVFASDEGWLLGGEVFASAGAPLEGQCFCVVEIVRGQTTAGIALEVIAAGYVTATRPLRFPLAAFGGSLDGAGALRSITGATPAAGQEISETVPTNARWELLAFRCILTTSATVNNRAMLLSFDNGAIEYFRSDAVVLQPASTAYIYNFGQGLVTPLNSKILAIIAGLAINVRLGAGHRLRTVTTLLDATDQWSAVQYLVREWIEGG